MNSHTEIKQILAQIEQRENAATEGPWKYVRDGDYWEISPTEIEGKDNYEGHEPDYVFIAHSRTDVPRLLQSLKMACQALESDKMYFSLRNILTELKS